VRSAAGGVRRRPGARGARRVSSAVLLLLICLARLAPAEPPTDDPAAEPEIRDPLFELLVCFIEGDSLGAWTGDDLRLRLDRTGRRSKLPVQNLCRLERRAAVGPEVETRRGARVTRILSVSFDGPLRLPMPYSILGYHPGSLYLSPELRFSEWELGSPNVHVAVGEQVTRYRSAGLKAFRLDEGWIVLDAAALVDRLLGGKLDDTWTDGFALGRVAGRLQGVALGQNRQGKRLCGEIDFRRDKVLSRARPIARGVSRYVRPWLAAPAGTPSRIWNYEK